MEQQKVVVFLRERKQGAGQNHARAVSKTVPDHQKYNLSLFLEARSRKGPVSYPAFARGRKLREDILLSSRRKDCIRGRARRDKQANPAAAAAVSSDWP